MAATTFNWEQNWILMYDLDNAEGISKNDIVKASNRMFKKSIQVQNSTQSYDMPSTTLWALRNNFKDVYAVRDAFYKAFNAAKNSNKATIKKLVICNYANNELYIENN